MARETPQIKTAEQTNEKEETHTTTPIPKEQGRLVGWSEVPLQEGRRQKEWQLIYSSSSSNPAGPLR